jgi:hypothetical protein
VRFSIAALVRIITLDTRSEAFNASGGLNVPPSESLPGLQRS